MKQSKNLIFIVIITVVILIVLTYVVTSTSDDNTSLIDTNDIVVTEENVSQTQIDGKLLYQQNCQTCHALDKQLTGPPLRNFSSRGPWVKRENIYNFIHNPALFAKTNLYTQNLIKKYYGVIMQAFPTLTKAEIDAIVNYTNSKP